MPIGPVSRLPLLVYELPGDTSPGLPSADALKAHQQASQVIQELNSRLSLPTDPVDRYLAITDRLLHLCEWLDNPPPQPKTALERLLEDPDPFTL